MSIDTVQQEEKKHHQPHQRHDEGEVVAAIEFDARAPILIQAAAELSRLRHLPLRLIHVLAPDRLETTGHLMAERGESELQPMPDIYGFAPLDMTDSWARSAAASPAWVELKAAEQRLLALAEQYGGKGVVIRVEAIFGSFPGVLVERIQELRDSSATNSRPVLLLVSASTRRPGFLKAKLKPVQRLMAQSPVPVLVMSDQSHPVSFDKKPLRLLVADDLSEETLKVITTTESLVAALGMPVEIRHIHVEPVLTAGWALSPEYRMVVWPGITIEDRLINDHHESLKDKLRRRGSRLQKVAEDLGGHYHLELWHGSVAEEIQRAVHVLQADVSIFGQHHFLHRGVPRFGQMPFASMLQVDSAVLIAP